MNYKVTYANDFTEPFYGNESVNCRRLSKDTYILENKEDCITCVKDLLDVPEAEMTLELIKEDFSSALCPITELKANLIREYYNGRLSIYNLFLEDFQTQETVCYDIPLKYNSFSVEEDDKMVLHSAHIRILLTNEEI